MTAAVAARMADAAAAWLDTLDDGQRGEAAWPFPAEDERRRWFYTPTDHGGLALRAMDDRQQQAASRLLAAGLSRAGYVTATTVMGLESVLDQVEGWPRNDERGRVRDPGLYQLRVFGDPGADAWGWRVGGHHVSVHLTVVDGEVASGTPCFFGADPASSPLLGPHELRPLAAVEDLGRELVRSLDDEQSARAIVSPVPPTDIVTGNRPRVADGDTPLPLSAVFRSLEPGMRELLDAVQRDADTNLGITDAHVDALRYRTESAGLPTAAMTAGQRAVLDALLGCYLGRLPDEVADREAARLDTDRLAFAWAGATERGAPHYYRVQGHRLLVEYDNTQRGANHAHSVWRDPDGDFGDDVLATHYRNEHT